MCRFGDEGKSVATMMDINGGAAAQESGPFTGTSEFPTGTLGAGAQLFIFHQFAGVGMDDFETKCLGAKRTGRKSKGRPLLKASAIGGRHPWRCGRLGGRSGGVVSIGECHLEIVERIAMIVV